MMLVIGLDSDLRMTWSTDPTWVRDELLGKRPWEVIPPGQDVVVKELQEHYQSILKLPVGARYMFGVIVESPRRPETFYFVDAHRVPGTDFAIIETVRWFPVALDSLSLREYEVLFAAGKGDTVAACSRDLNISVSTMYDHLRHIRKKLSLTADELSAFAARYRACCETHDLTAVSMRAIRETNESLGD